MGFPAPRGLKRMFAVDLTELPLNLRRRMHQVLTDRNAFELVQAKIRQQKIAQFYHQNRPRSLEAIGGLETAIDPYWVQYFRMKYGEDIWEDPNFRDWLKKRFEEIRVKHSGTKLQIGYSTCGFGVKPRFRKVYESRRLDKNKTSKVRKARRQ